MRSRRSTACPHRVHQRRFFGTTDPEPERGFASADEGFSGQGHSLRHDLPPLQGRIS